MTIIQFNPHTKGNRRQDDAHPEGRQHARQHTHEDASQRIAPGIRFVPGSLTEVRIDPNWLGSGVCADRDKGLSFYVLVLSYCVQDDPDDDPDPGAPAQAGWCQLQNPTWHSLAACTARLMSAPGLSRDVGSYRIGCRFRHPIAPFR